EGYRAMAGQMFQKFNHVENRQICGHVALTCLLAPTPVGNLNRLNVLADIASGGENLRPNSRWYFLCKALAEYRGGRYSAAQQWAVKARGALGSYCPETVELLVAMSQQHVGDLAL